ncbi:sld1 [Symbiodinium microadriaticum]|nr:sld1 [Symbiodinium microadriaticum]
MYNCMSSWQEGLAYLLLSHALAGVLHVQITLSHFAEQTYHGQAYNDETDEWFHMQVKTSLNHGITYNELPFFEGIQRVIDKLHLTAKETRYLKLTDGGFYDSAIFHGANLLG